MNRYAYATGLLALGALLGCGGSDGAAPSSPSSAPPATPVSIPATGPRTAPGKPRGLR